MNNTHITHNNYNTLDLPYYNSTSYPLAVKEQLNKLEFSDEDKVKLKYHQFIVEKFFTRNKHLRGILICHSMGTGKTRIAVSIAEHYRKFDKRRNIIILLPKSLEGNFKNTLRDYSNIDDDMMNKKYKFVSLNASNMFKQVSSVDKSKEEIEYEKKLGDFMNDIKRSNSLDDSLLIVDEAHNFFNSITNGSKNAVALYDLIISSNNLKIIFLTGTPIINDPFELIPCFNMLRGYIIIDSITGGDELPDDAAELPDDAAESPDELPDDAVESSDEALESSDEVPDDAVESSDESPDEALESSDESPNDTTKSSDESKKTHTNKYTNKSNRPINNKNINTKKDKTDRVLLFSEDYEEFENYFVDKHKKTIKNKDKFMNRIYGLTSYYGDLYFNNVIHDELNIVKGSSDIIVDKNSLDNIINKSNSVLTKTNINDIDTIDKSGFPEKLPVIIEKVPMSDFQFTRYSFANDQEIEEAKRKFKTGASRFSSGSSGSSTYRVKTRQISNYCIPEYALGPPRGNKNREKFIDKIKDKDLINTDTFSPKMSKILYNINVFKNKVGVVYSQFVSGEGLGIFSRVLDALGYINFNDNHNNKNEFDMEVKEKRYALLSGDIEPKERVNIINIFNSPSNKDGSMISLLLLSGAVAEGIDLKRVRHVHIMEPFWNYARINQVETRAIRYLSHADLPPEERNVQVYIYLSDYPIGLPKNKIKMPTTDIDMYNNSINNMKIINSFMKSVAESSIDCSIHFENLKDDVKKNIKCKLCSPDNIQLFHPILKKDMTLSNNCKPLQEKKVNVNEIIGNNGEKFYYKINNADTLDISLYSFNKKLNGFTKMDRSVPYYGDLMQKIISLM